MNIKLIERLASALGHSYHVASDYRILIWEPSGQAYLEFNPENDKDLMWDCLVELMNEDHCLNTLYADYWVDGFELMFKTPEEAVYTAFCEMKEDER